MKKILHILLMFLVISCDSNEYVRFESAQPEGVNESKSFNRKVRGEYINCSNPNHKLIVSNKMILNAHTIKLKSHRNDLVFDPEITINRNNNKELKKLFISEGYKIEIYDDTIYASQTNIDTVFWISENHILKKFNKSYFLNFKQNENTWNVNRLNLKKDTLFFSQITPSDSLLRFDFVTKTEDFINSDNTNITVYLLNPSKKEFKKLLKPNSFDKYECYLKKSP